MFSNMEKWIEIRRRVLGGEISKRAACQEYEIHWDTLQKILSHTEPPGYRLTKRRTSKLEPFLPIIEEIIMSDRQVHRQQRHTVRRCVAKGSVLHTKRAWRRWFLFTNARRQSVVVCEEFLPQKRVLPGFLWVRLCF